MKIKYFSYITEQSFKTLPNGERVFYFGLPWSKPFVLPDKDIEQRIYKKLLWINRLLLGSLIVGQPFLFNSLPKFFEKPDWWLTYLFGVILFFWVISWIVLRKDLHQIQRTKSPNTSSFIYHDMAERHSEGALALGLLLSIAFVALCIWIMCDGTHFYIGLACVIIFLPNAIGWGYAFNIKSANPPQKT